MVGLWTVNDGFFSVVDVSLYYSMNFTLFRNTTSTLPLPPTINLVSTSFKWLKTKLEITSFPHLKLHAPAQRVLNELYEDFLAVAWFLILLLAHPHPHSPVSTQPAIGEGGRGWARSRILRPQESLVLHISFNTLCSSR